MISFGEVSAGAAWSEVVVASLQPIGALLLLLAALCLRIRPKKTDVPGPPPYPIVGILPHLIADWERWPERCSEYSKRFGQRTWGGPLPNTLAMGGAVYFITDPSNVRHVLATNFDNYEKGAPFRNNYDDLLGTGIFAADGAVWKMHRKLISHMFSKNLLRVTGEVTLTKLRVMEGIFCSKIQSNNANAGATIDIQEMFHRMTFDTTCYVAFGFQMNCIQSDGAQGHRFARAFDEMQLLLVERYLDPFFNIKRLMQIGVRERRIATLKKILGEESMKIINERKKNARDGRDKLDTDLLSRYLNQQSTATDDELKSFVLNILLAGRDTTACSLAWAFFELSRHPDVVRKIIQEAKLALGNVHEVTDNDYSHEKLGNMRYTHAVVKEVLRLHPAVPNNAKYAINDDTLPDGTFVHAGSMVTWLPLAMGRSEKIWGDDAEEFRPDRFLDIREPSLFKYPVFNAGPRTCLGMPLAIQTMTMTLAYILPRFHFVDCIGHSGEPTWRLILSMKGGFTVRISERKVD